MTQQPVSIPFGGGLDLVSPESAKKAGSAIAALNYEPLANGYGRLKGFERFDGRVAPSDTAILTLNYTLGDFDMTGSGLYAGTNQHAQFLIIKQVVTSGSYGGGDAAGYMIISMIYGTVADLDNLIADTGVGLVTHAKANGAATSVIPVAEDAAALLITARTSMRGRIAAVPGSGPGRGVWFFDGDIYAVRNDSGFGKLYKAVSDGLGAGGWTDVSLGSFVAIDHLQHQVSAGDVITGASSGATATIYHTTLDQQTDAASLWTSNDTHTASLQIAPGGFTGNFTASEDVTVGGVTCGKVYASFGPYPKSSILGDNGKYQFVNFDFGTGSKIYWAQGEDFAYEFDGTNPPKVIGVGLSFFTRIAVYKNALFLSGSKSDASNGSHLFISVVGDPTNVNDATLGATELTLGSDIVDMVSLPNGLVILCENHIYLLSGNDYTDYVLETVSAESGALAYTTQRFGNVIYTDNSGIRTLSSGQGGYGNSPAQTISRLIAPYLVNKRVLGVSPTTSFICRSNSQYWLFFDDGSGVVVLLEGKPSAMPVNLGITVFTSCSVEVAGVERIFLGTQDGFVYELNKGTSFDGAAIEYYIRLPFFSFGSSQVLKRVHKAQIEASVPATTTLSVSADFDDGTTTGLAAQTVILSTGGSEVANLGSNEAWFDQQIPTAGDVYLDGVARNVSLKIGGSSATEEAHVITGVTYLISARGLQR